MRTIKFRAWDGEKYITFDNHEYDLVFNDISGWNVKPNLPNYKGEWTCGESQSQTHDFVLEQYTGLKDKNGVEIYEGDICRFTDHPTNVDTCVSFVKFSEGYFYCNHNAYSISGYGSSWIEVIGNIHEHKHLLK